MIPTRLPYLLLAALALLALLYSLDMLSLSVWLSSVALGLGLALLDAIWLYARPQNLELKRQVEQHLPVGHWHTVQLTLHNPATRARQLIVFDHAPESCLLKDMPQNLALQADQQAVLRYQIKPTQRGPICFAGVALRIRSPLRLWWRQCLLPLPQTCKVYPNYIGALNDQLSGLSSAQSALDIKAQRRRGDGTDFEQLREYRQGDALRQIDWNASARLQKLISKQYQDERDQQVIVMLDCGRRMRAQHGDLSHFDYALNSTIHLARAVLAKGDAISVQAFAGQAYRFTPWIKGRSKLNLILNQLYDLDTSLDHPDYLKAAQQLCERLHKRALVILVTNLRDEDQEDLLPALQLLQQHRHLVLIANLREAALDRPIDVQTFEDALRYAATQHYLNQRQHLNKLLMAQKVLLLDLTPDQLRGQLINSYVSLKNKGHL